MIERAILMAERVCKYGVWASGVLVLFMAVYICIDVLLRKLFSVSISGGEEFSGYTLAIMSGWAFSYALFKKAHVRIDILYLKLPLKYRSALDLLSLVALIIFVILTTYYAFGVLHTSILRNSVANTPLQTPLWIPQSLWFVSLVFFSIVLILFLVGT
ncbi:MAG: TRAP transporter small permease, partial [Synergistetes bacterium]|nr:TRAP transporter small permease [Synergistota bacterium]